MKQANKRITELEVGQFATRDIRIAKQKSTLKDVHDLMEEFKISHIPICDDNGAPVGLIAERDIRAFYLSPDFDRLYAEQIMQKKFFVFLDSTKLSAVTEKLTNGSGCAAIIKSTTTNNLGIFTVSDALKALNHVFNSINEP